MRRKPTNDPNLFAKHVFENLLEKIDPEAIREHPATKLLHKDQKAVESGRKGGLKGGVVRAEKLSPDKRRSIARKAAEARWKGKVSQKP